MTDTTQTTPEDPLRAAAEALPRRRFFSDMPDKGLFAIVAFVGFIAICWLKVTGWNADLITALAVGIMIAYGLVAFQMPLVQMRLDRLGDNFYYLGFIYTLASLTAALLQLREQVDVRPLLESFGIALVTTIVGIAGRVLFVQLRSDLDDIEERVRRDLVSISAELRSQLGQSIREFEVFRTTLLQVLSETRDECVRTQKQQIEQISALATSAAEAIEAAFAGNQKQASELGDSVKLVAKSVRQATQRLAEMQLPSDQLNSQLEEFSRQLEAILTRLGGIVEDVAQRAVHRRRWYWPFR